MSVTPIQTGCLESLEQLRSFIDKVDENQYSAIDANLFESSIGQHFRHVLDLFHALHLSQSNSLNNADYNLRRRGHGIESDKQIGLNEIRILEQWILELTPMALETPLTITTEVALSADLQACFNSSLGRELCFAASHLTHHLALMAIMAKSLGMQVDKKFGLAPATATHLRVIQ